MMAQLPALASPLCIVAAGHFLESRNVYNPFMAGCPRLREPRFRDT